CLADDLDGDDTGPSICDSSKEKERGVFRAIRKVFASFYNDNAFIERLRHNLNENEAGMALLVHHSFPDETELANGVATIKKKEVWDQNVKLVTQTGAVSVTNPDSNAVPEEVNVDYSSHNDKYYPSVIRESSLVLLGGTVMSWEDDYAALSQKLLSVAEAFEEATGKTEYTLDFEYKKIAPDGKLVIKQVREIPLPDTTPTITPFLINKPTEYCAYQGESGDYAALSQKLLSVAEAFEEATGNMEVFALHRLKSRWTLETESFWMTEENLAKGFHTRAELEYMLDDQVFKKSGMMSEWPDSAYEFKDNSAITEWTFSDSLNPRSCKLETQIPKLLVSASENPLLTPRDFRLIFHAEYETPV
ncbi:MAG: hypothetical protein GY795_40015, partial [Desulfobacterales bacterium]|nr:hypothetical protein [Desulfobacterales bacterium]